MYVISGASGRIGSVVADRLLDSGHPVRAVVRRPEAAADWASRGAEAVVLDLRDSQKLTEALNDATAFFAMLPFDLFVPDLDQYAVEVVQSVSNAVKDAGVRHTVMLSSGGADLTEGTGPILGLHHMEQALARTGTALTALRPGHFQEKFGDVLGAVLHEGVFPVFASSADTPLPMVATRDIAEIAVQELLADTRSVRLWTSWVRSTRSARLLSRWVTPWASRLRSYRSPSPVGWTPWWRPASRRTSRRAWQTCTGRTSTSG